MSMDCQYASRRGCIDASGSFTCTQLSTASKRSRGDRPRSVRVLAVAAPETKRDTQQREGAECLNKYSRNITQSKRQGASQAMLYATGLDEKDMDKAQVAATHPASGTTTTIDCFCEDAKFYALTWQVGISSVWYEGNPCNMHLLELADYVKEGVASAGLIGYRWATTIQ